MATVEVSKKRKVLRNDREEHDVKRKYSKRSLGGNGEIGIERECLRLKEIKET
jgi:hypothetical protein